MADPPDGMETRTTANWRWESPPVWRPPATRS